MLLAVTASATPEPPNAPEPTCRSPVVDTPHRVARIVASVYIGGDIHTASGAPNRSSFTGRIISDRPRMRLSGHVPFGVDVGR